MPRERQPGRASSSWKQRAWSELHTHALRIRKISARRERAWLDRFAKKIPCAGCRAHWKQIVATHPPDLRTRRAFFVWTVRAHNEVNRIVGKPIVEIAAAFDIWNASR